MATDIDMASNALLRIGHTGISALSESPVASNIYTTIYEDLLTKTHWRFAMKKGGLSRLTSTPANEFQYAFQLPSDRLLVVGTYPDVDYEIYDDKLYANVTEVEMEYIFKPDETRLPPYFVKLMELKLAAEFAIAITRKRTEAEQYEILFNDQLRIAIALDSQSRPPESIHSSEFISVRY